MVARGQAARDPSLGAGGVNGQRQWNDVAAARTTPVRLGLYSLAALIVQRQPDWQGIFRRSAWQAKARLTFADPLAQVRRALWRQLGFSRSEAAVEKQKPTQESFTHFAEWLAYVAWKWTNWSLDKAFSSFCLFFFDCLAEAKAPSEGMEQPGQGFGVGPVAA